MFVRVPVRESSEASTGCMYVLVRCVCEVMSVAGCVCVCATETGMSVYES